MFVHVHKDADKNIHCSSYVEATFRLEYYVYNASEASSVAWGHLIWIS
jgi:hypothetical protein